MITRIPRLAPAMPGRGVLGMGHLITKCAKSVFAHGRHYLRHTAAASENAVALDPTRIDQFIQEHNVATIPRQFGSADDTGRLKQACPIKCLIFLAENTPLLVILRLDDRVSEQALARHLNLAKSRISMAPTDRLVEISGFPVGEVPPFGHRHPLPTLIDQNVVNHPYIVFGHNLEYMLPATELLRAASGEVAPVSVTSAAAAAIETQVVRENSQEASSSSEAQSEAAAKAHLPLPWMHGAQAVTISGIVAQKRKIANLLVFLNIVPTSTGGLPARSTAAYVRRLWSHPETRAPCEVQLILGKTLERKLGRTIASGLFKALKPGQIIKVTGAPQPHVQPADGQSRAHVVDLVVHNIDILGYADYFTSQVVLDEEESGSEEESSLEDYDMDDTDESSAYSRKQKKALKKSLTPATAAALNAEFPVYKLQVPPENVVLVDNLQGIKKMQEILLAHRKNAAANSTSSSSLTPTAAVSDVIDIGSSEAGNDGNGGRGTPALLDADTTKPAPPLLSAKARARAAKRAASMDPGTWKPALVLGMDAEWQPTSRDEPSTPVSILQIGSKTHVFLIDMLALCYNPRKEQEELLQQQKQPCELTLEQRALNDVLEAVLADKDIIKIGFGLRYDFKRLIESYPWMPCFGGDDSTTDTIDTTTDGSTGNGGGEEGTEAVGTICDPPPSRVIPIQSHVDALVLARSAGDGRTAYKRLGLAAVCKIVLGCSLDKSEQTSEWGARPLSTEQLHYAAADVASLVDIFDTIIGQRPEFLAPFWMAQFAGHMTDMAAIRPRMKYQSRQGREYVGAAENAMPGAALPWQGAQVTGRGLGATSQVQCNVSALMSFLGSPVPDGGKLAVVKLASSETLESGGIVEPARMPRFPRGSGVLEFSSSTFLLFVNVPSHRYPNEFTLKKGAAGAAATGAANNGEDQGQEKCLMTWWPGKGQTLSNPTIRRLLPVAAAATDRMETSPTDAESSGDTDMVLPTVLLFVRPQRDDYVCCGRLEPASVDVVDGQLCVSWELLDYPGISASPFFQQILRLQRGGKGALTLGEEEESNEETEAVGDI